MDLGGCQCPPKKQVQGLRSDLDALHCRIKKSVCFHVASLRSNVRKLNQSCTTEPLEPSARCLHFEDSGNKESFRCFQGLEDKGQFHFRYFQDVGTLRMRYDFLLPVRFEHVEPISDVSKISRTQLVPFREDLELIC